MKNNTLTFTLVSGALDNHLFTLESNGSLQTAAAFDFERNLRSMQSGQKLEISTTHGSRKTLSLSFWIWMKKTPKIQKMIEMETNDSKIDENQNDDLDDGLPPVTDGNQTVVDHNDTKPDPTVVEPVTPNMSQLCGRRR